MSKAISIHNRNNDALVAIIGVEDGKLSLTSFGNEEIKQYFEAHKAEWETSSFTVHRSQTTPDGTIHDRRDKVKLGDEDYLNGLWEELYQKARVQDFEMRYYFVVS